LFRVTFGPEDVREIPQENSVLSPQSSVLKIVLSD
jgi:hypothetical protein